MKRALFGLAGAVVLSWATTASAITVVGDIILENSWGQQFYQDNSSGGTGGWPGGNGSSAFDRIVITVVGGAFEAPAVNGLTGDWTAQMFGNTAVSFQGSDTTLEYFTLHWMGDPWWTQLNLWTYLNGNLVCAEYFTPGWGHGWLGENSVPNMPQVPDGGLTALLLGMGMLALGQVRRMVK